MDIVFVSLGSKGNATLIRQGDTVIQIDMGVSLKRISQACGLLGINPSSIHDVFITHSHTDHVSNLYRYKNKKIYAGISALPAYEDVIYLEEGVAVDIGELTIMPFSSSHDALTPFNFVILGGGEKFGYVTDTGYIKTNGRKLLSNCDYYLMESNYDVDMLFNGPYSASLKKRIHGKKGHLSNLDSALYLSEFMGKKTKQVFLGHLSDENNTPDKALVTYLDVLNGQKKDISGVQIIAIPQKTTQIGGQLLK